MWVSYVSGPVFSYKLRYIVGFWLVEMAISTNLKPTIYRNLYENTGPDTCCVLTRNIVEGEILLANLAEQVAVIILAALHVVEGGAC